MARGDPSAGMRGLFPNKARVLLVLPQNVLDRARVKAGKMTTALKLPVSVQIVLRALIEEGLKRDDDGTFRANVEAQAQAVRRIRRFARQAGAAQRKRGHAASRSSRRSVEARRARSARGALHAAVAPRQRNDPG
jgi:hypothetical protein